ncbi:energy transducer TonB [Hymenobacter daeguensis]
MMTNAQLATASLDDIVFDGRNRHYGAYQLRALYQRHMTRALIIATAMLALLLVFPLLGQLLAKDVVTVVPPIVVDANPSIIDMPDEPEVLPPPPAATRPAAPPPQPPTMQDVVPVVTTDDKVKPDDNKVPNQDELIDAKPGLVTAAGDPGADPNANLEELKPGTGPGGNDIGETVTEKPYLYVEQMPQLPGGGGMGAIVAAIQKSVKYPGEALRNQIEGKVFVSFVVNSVGEVSDVKVLKPLGYGLDEETMRAVKSLPKFIPGKQNGRAVSVAFTVPISFKIQ